MSKRNYNVFFNTHTISGIVISVALYVIFFAGAFALFKDEIAIWEKGEIISHIARKDIDYDSIFKNLDKTHELSGRDLQINFGEESDEIYMYMLPSKDTLATEKGKTSGYFSVDINTYKTKKYNQLYGIGEFLYRLHFFSQLPKIGLYLAGFVSLFFLFAVVTGVIVYWKKIIPNFYNFNPKVTLKRVWTDAHTVLGVIGLPFQLIYAITGAYFGLSILVLLPAKILYGGDQNKLMEDLRPERKTYEWIAKSNKDLPSFNNIAKAAGNYWDNFHLTRGFIRNYGGTNMTYVLIGELEDRERFVGTGRLIYNAQTETIQVDKVPHEMAYSEDLQRVVSRLHFADYGGFPVKLIYLIMALVTCFVILTGVLIWIEARNKKSMSLKQRLYTAKVGHIYLAICLTMLPVTALAFLFVKIFYGYFDNPQTAIYWFYFVTWLAFIVFFRFKRNNYITNKYNLLLGAILGFLVPVVNGIVSGHWIWVAIAKHQYEIVLVDVLWIAIATTALLTYRKIKPEVKNQSTFAKNPIDYKNLKRYN